VKGRGKNLAAAGAIAKRITGFFAMFMIIITGAGRHAYSGNSFTFIGIRAGQGGQQQDI